MRRCEIDSRAEREIDQALEWYGSIHPRLKRQLLSEISDLQRRIMENPAQFPRFEGEIRRAVFTGRFPYSLFFLEKTETVRLLALFHHSRAPEDWRH